MLATTIFAWVINKKWSLCTVPHSEFQEEVLSSVLKKLNMMEQKCKKIKSDLHNIEILFFTAGLEDFTNSHLISNCIHFDKICLIRLYVNF